MPDYKGIQGTAVQNFAGDPTNPIIGQVWYNSISGKFRYNEVAPQLGAWTTGGTMNTVRNALAGAGIQTAALAFGGETTVNVANTESWNGTSWSQTDELNTGVKNNGSAGTQTLALSFAGQIPALTAATEEFDNPSLSSKVVTAS